VPVTSAIEYYVTTVMGQGQVSEHTDVYIGERVAGTLIFDVTTDAHGRRMPSRVRGIISAHPQVN
jgi:hypothetical protein